MNKKDYVKIGDSKIYFSKNDTKKINRMRGEIVVVSTVCPDYPNNGQRFTFDGKLGEGVSLTSSLHIKQVPLLLRELEKIGSKVIWHILLADLPELIEEQREFYERVAGSKELYLEKCRSSAQKIREAISEKLEVSTFSQFYSKMKIDYLKVQTDVAREVLASSKDKDFCSKFSGFMFQRKDLAEKFRGRRLNNQELEIAAAHGMSLYISHGTLLRRVFVGKNLIVVNHDTLNVNNFFMSQFVKPFHEDVKNSPKFPIGLIEADLY